MPEFTNPFIGMVPRKMTKEELIRAIRLNISAEHEAVHIYMAHADATDDPLAKKVLTDVANEEREHIGEFQQLLRILAPDEDVFVADGVGEVEAMRAELAGTGNPGAETDPGGNPGGAATVNENIAPEQTSEAETPELESSGHAIETIEEVAEEAGKKTAGIKTIGSLRK